MSRTIKAILILSIKYNFEQSFAVQISPLLLLKIEKVQQMVQSAHIEAQPSS
jgi:hypothetical protein